MKLDRASTKLALSPHIRTNSDQNQLHAPVFAAISRATRRELDRGTGRGSQRIPRPGDIDASGEAQILPRAFIQPWSSWPRVPERGRPIGGLSWKTPSPETAAFVNPYVLCSMLALPMHTLGARRSQAVVSPAERFETGPAARIGPSGSGGLASRGSIPVVCDPLCRRLFLWMQHAP